VVARDTTTTLFAALNVLTGVAIGRCRRPQVADRADQDRDLHAQLGPGT
jgi:hypothetical protein